MNIHDIIFQLNKLETDNIIFLVDDNVTKLYTKFEESIKKEVRKDFFYITLPAGEACKTYEVWQQTMERILESNIHRGTHLVAIGGGATSDLAGFCASTLLRGIDWSVVPTTLLSMVDASIGGKTGINSQWGKNLLGTFYLPKHIWVSLDFLKTLPDREMNSGKGEILKYCFLDEQICKMVKDKLPLADIIKACSAYKNSVTCKDLREQKRRAILNLGHTIGHGIERLVSGISHGEAIYWGMELLFKMRGNDDMVKLLLELKHALGCHYTHEAAVYELKSSQLIDFILKDKKRTDKNSLSLITIESPGECYLEKMDLETFEDALTEVLDF